MNSDAIIKNICRCLELLVCENQLDIKDSESKDEALLTNLERNIDEVIQVVSNDSYISKVLHSYRHTKSQTSDELCWNFVQLCLILLKSLDEVLLLQEQESLGRFSEMNQPPRGILSISQEKTLKRCFQFLIALGIIPNLIPSIQAALCIRTSAVRIVKNLEIDTCDKKRYYRLIACMSVLIDSLKQSCLHDTLLANHSGDLLVVLFQICYAPIKKSSVQNPVTDVSSSSEMTSRDEHMKMNRPCQDFNQMLKKINECCRSTDEEFVKEMWADRKYFILILDKLLKQLHPSVLLWELLLLRGANEHSKDFQGRKAKMPMWFERKCSEILTTTIMAPSGVKNFITVVLDKMLDVDVKSGVVSQEKIDAVSKLIAMNPVKHLSVELYVKSISSQILELLHTKGTPMDKIFTCVTCMTILHLIDLNSHLAEKYIFNIIFQPLWQCLKASNEVSATEENITLCVDDAHQIFVQSTSILSQEAIRILLPFYDLLFKMYAKLLSGISYIKNKVEDLLLIILNNSENTMLLLQMATFEDVVIPHIHSATHLKCTYGDSDGIQILKANESSPEDMLEEMNNKCQAILNILNKLANKKLKLSFFLFLLKRSSSVETLQEKNLTEKDDSCIFLEHLISVHLLEELSEQVGEELISDVDESIELISTALSCCVDSNSDADDVQLSEEKLVSALPILTTIIGYKDQLTHKHWTALKKCLPILEKLISQAEEPFIKNIAANICTAIRTHGAVFDCTNTTKARKANATQINPTASSSSQVNQFINLIGQSDYSSKTRIKQSSPHNLPNVSETEEIRENKHYKPKIEEISSSTLEKVPFHKKVSYDSAMADVQNPSLPTRGHGLLTLCKLLETKDETTVAHLDDLRKVFQENMSDEDSYIYLPSIRGLSALADINTEFVLPILISEMDKVDKEKLDLMLKIGEVFLKVCQDLGELTIKYRDVLLNTFLRGARHKDPHVRASSLSNLGEVCKRLRFSIGNTLQEVLLCVKCLLKMDPDVVVRRSAMLVLRLLFQGTGSDTFKILETDIKDLYSLLKWTYETEKDDILKLQCQLALEEINDIVKNSLKTREFTKEIRICDPF